MRCILASSHRIRSAATAVEQPGRPLITLEQLPFGLWPSPVSPRSLAVSLRLGEPCWDSDGRTLGWVEGRSDRGLIVLQDAGGGATRDLTTDLSVRAFVGYGGGDFTLAHGSAYFVAQADQRIYRQPLAGGPARPITPAFGAATSPAVSPDGRWVAYVHSYEDVDCVAVVDSEGRQWPRRLAEGPDFSMQPCWSPDGKSLAWIEWDHPNMPWDSTRLVAGSLSFDGPLPAIAHQGGSENPGIAFFQPGFTQDGRELLYVSDESGWGSVAARDCTTGEVHSLLGGEGDYGRPAWAHGMRTYCVTPAGRVVAVRSRDGFDTLVARTRDGRVEDLGHLHAGYTALAHPVASPAGERIAVVASGGTQPPRVVTIDLAAAPDAAPEVRRRSDSESVPAAALSSPQAVSWPSFDGEAAHGLYYPPASDRFAGTGAPPLIVLVHGGPTSQAVAAWSPQAQFFATRGYAVLQVNYRGSTGYGRPYMLKLRESWGVYDVRDSMSGARSLADRGLADGGRLVIMGGSAGGFTVLQSLVEHPGVYRAGICLFGVSNMFTLASDTHKFEARYLDSMLGPLPAAADVYRARSPIFHAAKIVDPIAVFQGDADRVVPRAQSDTIVASLKARGIPHEYHVYEDEGHGWRKTETIEHFYGAVDRFLREHVVYA